MGRKHRPATRIAVALACLCAVAFGATVVAQVAVKTSSDTAADALSIASQVAGVLSALTAFVAIAITVRQGRRAETKARAEPLTDRHLVPEQRLIDRVGEMTLLIGLLEDDRVVNCYGRRGSGKSFVLEHLADVVNGHRSPSPNHPRPRKFAAAIYVDLADMTGFDEIEAQLGKAASGHGDANSEDFIARIVRTYPGRRVLLVLDNVNEPGVWGALGQLVYRYLKQRGDDRLVLGSIDAIRLANFSVRHLEFSGFGLDSVEELVGTLDVDLNHDQIADLCRECDGLPLQVSLLAVNGGGGSRGQTMLVDDRLIPRQMPHDTVRVLAHAALLALVTRRVSVADLEHSPLIRVEAILEEAEHMALLTPTPDNGRKVVKIHDVVRDAVLRRWPGPAAEAAVYFAKQAEHRGHLEHAALFAMFTDPLTLGVERFDRIVDGTIRNAVKTRNYALLSTLDARASDNAAVSRFRTADPHRADLFSFGRASALAGMGRYADAESALGASNVAYMRWDRLEDRSELHAEMRYLQADVTHLRNRYDESAQMFEELAVWALWAGRQALRARCVWAQGHVLRHQGQDLDRSLSLFAEAEKLAGDLGELDLKAYAAASATAIKVFLGVVPREEQPRLARIEEELAATSTHDGLLLKVWKAQAQVSWFFGHHEDALSTIEAAIESARARNDRALYNLYFERAEYRRLGGSTVPAADDYQRVFEFGRDNGDSNLIANALLGRALTSFADGRPATRATPDETREAALRARDLAQEADIHATARIAERVAVLAEAPAANGRDIRLMLF